jgi:hypothetical protein
MYALPFGSPVLHPRNLVCRQQAFWSQTQAFVYEKSQLVVSNKDVIRKDETT